MDPARLIIGNGASELIAFIEETLVKNIGIPVPTFSEYLEKLRNHRAAHFYWLDPKKDYRLDLDDYLPWIEQKGLSSALVINPGNPTGQFIPFAADASVPGAGAQAVAGDRGRVVPKYAGSSTCPTQIFYQVRVNGRTTTTAFRNQ